MHLAAVLGLCAAARRRPRSGERRVSRLPRPAGPDQELPGRRDATLQVDGAAFARSVHAPVGCAGLPRAGRPEDASRQDARLPYARAYAIAAVEACRGCHEAIYDAWLGSQHGKRASKASGLQGPICADCHRPHEATPASVGTRAQGHLPHLPRGRARGARRLAAEQQAPSRGRRLRGLPCAEPSARWTCASTTRAERTR